MNGGFTGALTVVFGASSPGVLRADRGDSVAEERKIPFSRPEAGEEVGGGGG